MFGLLKDKMNYIEPTFQVNSGRGARANLQSPAGPLTASGTAIWSHMWSGAVVFPPAGQNFAWLQADWVVPNVDAPTALTPRKAVKTRAAAPSVPGQP